MTEGTPRGRAGYLHPRGDLWCDLRRPLSSDPRLGTVRQAACLGSHSLRLPPRTSPRQTDSLTLSTRPPTPSPDLHRLTDFVQRALLSPLAPCPSPLPAPAGNFQKEGVFLAESGFFIECFCRLFPPAALAGADVIRWWVGFSSVLATLCRGGNAVVWL